MQLGQNNLNNNPNFGMALHVDKGVHKLSTKVVDTLVEIEPKLEKLAEDVDIFVQRGFGYDYSAVKTILDTPSKKYFLEVIVDHSPKEVKGFLNKFKKAWNSGKDRMGIRFEDSLMKDGDKILEDTEKLKKRFKLTNK